MSNTNIKKVRTSDLELKDRLVSIQRVTKVTKGGRTFSFSAIVVVGNEDGVVGYGLGKASEVQSAIAKGVEDAKKNLVKIPVINGTIPHKQESRYSGSLNTFSITARTRQLEVLLVNRAYKDFKSDDNGQNLLRQAISYAINRSELISSAYQNMATVAYTPIPSGTWLSNESTIRDIYDPLMAASLLDSAGYKLADDGNRYKDGKKMESLRLLVYDEPGSTARTNAANKIVDQLAAVGIPAYVATWSRESVQTKLVSGDYSIAMCGFNFDVSPDPGFTLTSTASCNYTRYRSNDMNDLITQLRKSYTADSYKNAMSLIQDQFEQDQPYICLYWRSAVLLSRETFTDVRDVRELEMLRGIENYGN